MSRARAIKAYDAVKKLGFPVQKIKPVLKNLLKVYENNWEFIEQEEYRALVDAILEWEETKGEECHQPSTSVLNSDMVIDESPSKKRKQNETGLSQTSAGLQNSEDVSYGREKQVEAISNHSNLGDRGTILTRSAARDKRPESDRNSAATVFKKPKIEQGLDGPQIKVVPAHHTCNELLRPKSELHGGDFSRSDIPIAMMRPPVSPRNRDATKDVNDHTQQSNVLHPVAPQRVNAVENGILDTRKHKETDPEAMAAVDASPANLEIASSSSGEVKLSLICHSVLNNSSFHMPNLDAVSKQVEDRCLKLCKTIEPKFSLLELMKEFCQSFVELGTGCTDNRQEEGLVNITVTLDSLKKSNLENVLSGRSFHLPKDAFVSASNGSPSSREVLTMPQTFSGLDNLHQTNGEVVGSSYQGKDNSLEGLEASEPSTLNSNCLAIVQHELFSFDEVRPLHDVKDICKGEETVKISVVNEVSSELCPPTFYYIPKNIIYQNAFINFSLARIGDEDCCADCFGDCTLSAIPCACARETGGEFAYTLDGVVRKEFLDDCISMNRDPHKHRLFYCQNCPLERTKNELAPDSCKGHIVRKFIKECWSKCGCNKKCGNRVVQRGITSNLQVFLTPEGKGWGLRTLEELPRGTFVCEYVGEVLTNTELYDRNVQSSGNERHTYPVLLDADWGSEGVLKDEEALCLDATFYGNVARFINHRCYDANLVEIPVEIETPDHHYYHLAFFTTRKVEALEELTWDYGIDFDDVDHPVKAFRCRCGSKCCRNVKNSSRSKRLLSLASAPSPKSTALILRGS